MCALSVRQLFQRIHKSLTCLLHLVAPRELIPPSMPLVSMVADPED